MEDAANHAIPQFRDAPRQVLKRQTEGKKSGVLDLDAIIEDGESDGRDPVGYRRAAVRPPSGRDGFSLVRRAWQNANRALEAALVHGRRGYA